jgi:protocatechuate 3,4-dioxygenase beta subunit
LGTISAGVASGVTKSYAPIANVSSATAATLVVTGAATPALDTFVLADSDSPYAAYAVGDVLKVGTAITTSGSTIPVGNYTVTAASAGSISFTGDTSVATATSANSTAGAISVEKFGTARTYAAQIVLDDAVYGSVSYKTVGAAAVDAAPTTALTRSANAFVGTAGSQSHVRLKATAVQVVASLKKDGLAVGSGVAATVRVTRDSLHADSTITVGGKTLTSTTTAGYVEYEATTNASGKIVIDIANNKGDESDGVTVTVTSSGLASVGHAIDWDVNDYTKYDFTESSAVANSIKAITKGSAYTLNWNIADEFGAGPAEDWQVKVTYTFLGASQTQAVKFVPFASGKASLAITDASTAAGSYTVAAVAQKRNTSSGNYEDVDPNNSYFASSSDYTFNTTVVVRDVVEAKALTLTATSNAGTSASIEADDFTAVDYRFNRNQDNTAYDNTEYYTLSGVVTDANGAGLPGASVTVSAEGFAFVAGDVSAVGSITVIADASGNYSVKGVSHKAGTYKATAVAGAFSKTADVTVDNSTTAADIKSVTITALDKIAAGYTAAVKVTVLDKWGNAVKDANAITLTHVGPGYLSAYPTAVSATDGSTTFVLISAGAKGIATFTVKAAAGTTTTDDVTVSKSILVGITASVSAGSKKANVVVKSATGASVTVVSGTKSVTKIATSESFKVSLTKLTKGKKTVKVYVNDILVSSKSVTVKK